MRCPNWTHVWRWVLKALTSASAITRRFLWVIILAVVVTSGWAVINYWDWLRATPVGRESNFTTIRDFVLLAGGISAIGLAAWRSRVAERQANTAQQSLLHDRYQRGAEMLGSDVLAVRLGGVYALQRLAEEHPPQYHVQIMTLFCAFVRNPTGYMGDEFIVNRDQPPHILFRPLSEDVQAVMIAIGARGNRQLTIEEEARYRLDLHGSDLRGARLNGANLASAPRATYPGITTPEYLTLTKGTDLTNARLCSAQLEGADLRGVSLTGACLCKAGLEVTDLSNANLAGASMEEALKRGGPVLTGARFSYNGHRPARGIRQIELDFCTADPSNPPELRGVVDPDTGVEVFWRGHPSQATKT